MCGSAYVPLARAYGEIAVAPSTIWAVIAAEIHLFPFRTEKLSPPAPMVLGAQAPGRVGRRPFFFADRNPLAVGTKQVGSGDPGNWRLMAEG